MPAIHLDHLSFSYSSAVDVLADVNVHFAPGWTALVGANGSGKTSLLRLIAGELAPSAGSVILDPAGAVVAYCEQESERLTDGVRAFGASWAGPDATLRGRLRLDPEELSRWPSLSPGERKRWQVGAALALDPDMLLLDEPTNHLDAEGRTWLLDALQRFTGVGLVVSHDRTFLESLTTRTLRVHNGQAELWNGSYSVAHAAWTEAHEQQVAEYQRLRTEQKKLDRRISDQRRAAETKRALYQRRIREADFKDIDARSTVTQGHFLGGEAAAAKKLSTTVRARDRVAALVGNTSLSKERGGELFIDFEPAEKAEVAVVIGDLAAGDRVLVRDLAVVLRRTDRVWLRGGNGAGKTTLLEALLRSTPLPAGEILHVPQELTEAEAAELLGTIHESGSGRTGSSSLPRGEARCRSDRTARHRSPLTRRSAQAGHGTRVGAHGAVAVARRTDQSSGSPID